MCEIAILKPSDNSINTLTNAAMHLYHSQQSSLGIVAVYNPEERFTYNIYKSVDPGYHQVKSFISDNDSCVRFIIHGRLATHGAVTEENAHPIEINCAECNIDYVLHNGVVRTHDMHRRQLTEKGHEMATEVDSEVIAHKHGSVPKEFSDAKTDRFGRQAAWILLGEERMYVNTSGIYNLTGDMRMKLARRDFGFDVYNTDSTYKSVIMHADPEEAQ